MAIIGGSLGYKILCQLGGEGEKVPLNRASYQHASKLEVLLGKAFWEEIRGRTVMDFGCGTGAHALEMARRGAARVLGVDIQEDFLNTARREARARGLDDRCEFTASPDEQADLIVALDSFEHFEDPAAILRTMHGMIKPEGQVIASFGPTWYHPYGGHLFSIFPWAHLLFSEKSLLRWRSNFKDDGATRFREVAGGLNQMTIARFIRIVRESPFEFQDLELVPIRKLKPVHNRLTREFTTAVVRCRLTPESQRRN